MSIMNRELQQLKKLYQNIESTNANFQQHTCLSCVKNCGECCSSLQPYASTLEAIPIANYLKANSRVKEYFTTTRLDPSHKGCPFYDPKQELHCTIYSVRPLICRMFGYAANRQQNKTVFHPCQVMERSFLLQVEKAQEMIDQNLPITIYQDAVKSLQQINFDLATDYHMLEKSVYLLLQNSCPETSVMQPNREVNKYSSLREFLQNQSTEVKV